MTDGRAEPGTVAVTGASGYVGRALVRSVRSAGFSVLALSRSGRVETGPGVAAAPFELGAPLDPAVLSGCSVLVHAAHDFAPRSGAELARANVEGSRRLYAAAAEAGVGHVVFISSIAAYPGCVSDYGRVKLAIEAATVEAGGSVLRPGLVFGDDAGSIMGTLSSAARRLPLVPLLVGADRPLFLGHEDDVGALCAAMALRRLAGAIVIGASRQAVSLAALLRSAAPGRRVRLVPVPWQPCYAALRGAEALGLRLPFRADSLRSLATADPDPFARASVDAEELGVVFRPYRAESR